MTFEKIIKTARKSDPGEEEQSRPEKNFTVIRPRFDSKLTSDRLRESIPLPSFSMVRHIPKDKKSAFKELGLGDEEDDVGEKEFGEITGLAASETSGTEVSASPTEHRGQSSEDGNGRAQKGKLRWISKLAPSRRPRIKAASSGPPSAASSMHRFTMIALLIAVVLPTIRFNNGHQKVEMSGADAGVIRETPRVLEERANSPVDVSALINGTVYIYGGEAKTSSDQTTDTWNNNFLTLDLTKSWSTTSPALKGLPQPSGPPAVAMGYLWNDYNNLYLYGGEFADNPYVEPAPVSTWRYSIPSSSWFEYKTPVTSQGNFSENADIPVQRAAEGAGVSVPELGLSWYFGGHLDLSTTPGWSDQVPRVYLRSLLEFTHPGYANTGVDSLHTSGAGEGGVYRNITEGGIQDADGFSERADGVLVFVPGWGKRGILLGLGGGTVDNSETSDNFTSMQTIDVYDIESSVWYHQQVSGTAPEVRVNPCAVIFSAPDASSFNIYMYGGQNLLPFGTQTQYTDIWILSVPAFTWIKVEEDTSGGEPHARAGHTCHARDGQMVVIGGYVGQDVACESPGVFSFDASALKWRDSFTAADHPADLNPLNNVLAGSYGYKVPAPVQSVIGGSSDGGATATTPAVGKPTKGPFATGQPPVFTITDAGSTATVTSWGPGSTAPGSGGGGGGGAKDDSGPSGGLVAAGVIAGLTGLMAFYLGFCAVLYRRQVNAYKRHMAVANRYSGAGAYGPEGGAAAGAFEKLRKHRRLGGGGGGGGSSSSDEDEQFGWVGQLGEPKWASASEDHSPGSGSGSGSASNVRPRPSEDRYPWGYFDGPSGGGGGAGVGRMKSGASKSTASGSSTEGLLAGREPSFFSVVLGPRRALRVVNMED